MTSLFREVLLPSAAAVGLLFVASVEVVTAGEAAEAAPVQIAAATIPAARHQPAPTESTAHADLSRPGNKSLEMKRRCDRIQRIGKFTVTRCD